MIIKLTIGEREREVEIPAATALGRFVSDNGAGDLPKDAKELAECILDYCQMHLDNAVENDNESGGDMTSEDIAFAEGYLSTGIYGFIGEQSTWPDTK